MDITLLSVIALVAVALLFDYTNGFHDSANSVSTVVATGALRPRLAVLWAAAFNFVAFAFFGTKVADTIGQTVEAGFVSIAVIFAALAGAILWNYVTWWLGMPTSSSQALIGGLVGAGLAKGGLEAIKASSVQKAAVFMVLSPLAGMALAALLIWAIKLVFRRTGEERTERGFRIGQLASSAAVSLGHGTNDAQKTMGVIAALLVATGYLEGGGEKLTIPLWVVLSAHAAIALGTISGGWRIVRTMGQRITELRPARGFAAETAAAVALFGSTAAGAPVSTTQTVGGAVTGVGVADRDTTVNWGVFGQMALCWLVTIPSAALAAAAIYQVTRLQNHLLAGVVLGLLGVAAVVALTVGVRRTVKAADLEPERPPAPDRRQPVAG